MSIHNFYSKNNDDKVSMFERVKNCKIRFEYGVMMQNDKKKGEIKLRATLCKLINQENKIVAFGVAVCNSKDQFVKSVGRKIAFTKAVSAYNREIRTYLWQRYHNKKWNPEP